MPLVRLARQIRLNSTAMPNISEIKKKEEEVWTPQLPGEETGEDDFLKEISTLPSWDRGGKTKSNAMTPLLTSMRKLIDLNKGCICLVQVGGFYELYFEQASLIGPKLGLKVTTRKTTNHQVPMAGFPVLQLKKFVKMLIHDLEQTVAIIDQFPTQEESLLHRKVSRIVSPGTLVDESFMNYLQNNYLAAVYIPPHANKIGDPEVPVGITWMDISVGDFYVQQLTLGELAADLTRILPSEIVLLKEWQEGAPWLTESSVMRKYFVRYHKTVYRDHKLHLKADGPAAKKRLDLLSISEEAAMNLVLLYVNVNLPDRTLQLEVPLQYYNERYLHMDSRTREALELTGRTAHGSVSVLGSLLNTIRRTVTPSGTRLLTQWVKSPILDLDELLRRQSYVSVFRKHGSLTLGVRAELARVGDFARSLQRLALKTGDTAVHLQAVGDGLSRLKQLKVMLKENASSLPQKDRLLIESFTDDFNVPQEIADDIEKILHTEEVLLEGDDKIDTEGSEDVPFIFSVRRDYDAQLSSFHDSLDEVQVLESQMLDAILEQISQVDPKATVQKKDQYGRWMNVIAISCRLKFATEIQSLLDGGGDIREQRKTALVYKPAQWSRLQERRDSLTQNIEAVEREIIEGLRQKVLDEVSSIRNVSRMADFLDVTASFAVYAAENDFVCPRFVKRPTLNVDDGRHVVVESSLKSAGGMFSPNDVKLGTSGNLWVISGPNMGGKSTYLRQNALIVILAQIGAFVPASRASIGVVDRIFTRIGASDDIYSDLSTFMVEMVETSNILQNATPRSLAIVDEIGRGTSGKEGLAIAYGTLLSLLKTNKCRTLFATHFGTELKKMLDQDGVDQTSIRFMRTKVVETESKSGEELPIRFNHKLEPGISDRSYAFEVAKLAGFPSHSLEHAGRALAILNKAD